MLRPGSHLLLDGTWRFAIDLDDSGLLEEWAEGYDYKHTAQWPGSIEEHMALAHTGGAAPLGKTRLWPGTSASLPCPKVAR